ncbi:hypothetical protein PBY51_015465 [Eleginops maclovinus]|uniref:Uncharacterized protein n=1 Tax=Eleginops maclovinus TaxID=56733 RepID=A0AAN7X4H2_ELEMC|nr:hypothetical protein PBY51_015465 [Eleginops maclovinus]
MPPLSCPSCLFSAGVAQHSGISTASQRTFAYAIICCLNQPMRSEWSSSAANQQELCVASSQLVGVCRPHVLMAADLRLVLS